MKIGYARVSTIGQNMALQIDALTAAGCEELYQEKSLGKSFERKELDGCLKALRKGDQLIVWKLDRLGRSLKHLIGIVEDLTKRGVEFVSLTENLNTSTSGGKLVFSVFASLAEFERNLISERTKEGLAAARRRGKKGGRPKKLDDGQIRLAKKMLDNDDVTITEVAKHLKIGRNTLYRYLNS